MIKTYCDICGKETHVEKKTLKTGYTMNGSAVESVKDVCEQCYKNLMDLQAQVETEYVRRKGNLELKFD